MPKLRKRRYLRKILQMNECVPLLSGPLLLLCVVAIFITGFILGAMASTRKPDPFDKGISAAELWRNLR